jgi:hypothetical protein
MPGSAAGRRRRHAALEWTSEQAATLRRAVRLHGMGVSRQAAELVAFSCPFPTELQSRHFAETRLDIALWFRAYTGALWDGDLPAFQAARRASAVRRRRIEDRPEASWRGSSGPVARAYCWTHLMVEPTGNRSLHDQRHDFAEYVGWPDAFDCGHLDWQSETGLACAFCDALLLPSEAIPVEGTSVFRGRHCCARG